MQGIPTEIEILNDYGKLFKSFEVETENEPMLDLPESPLHTYFRPWEQFDGSNDSDSDDGDFDDADCDEGDICFKRLLECLTECFDKFCFVHGTFDPTKFTSLWQSFFHGNENVINLLNSYRFTLLKGKILSFMMKKLFVMLALTKTQMDTLNAFYKTVLLFVPGESCKLSKHIHAGYSSCVRECEKRVDKSDAFVEETFRGVRFVFGGVGLCLVWTRACLVLHGEIHIPRQCETIPLFFSVCHVSTGEDMASFLFQRLKQMHTPFSKLSSVVTDGANNIIGRENGMISHLKRLIQNETRNDDFSSLQYGVCPTA